MKKIFWIIGTVGIIALGIYMFNFFTIIKPTMNKINEDNRNIGISLDVHYKFYVIPNTLEINLKNVPSEKAMADVFRVFLQTSSALKDKNFDRVELKYKGTLKFFLNGDYYKQIGSEFEEQNPVYTMRTLPENLYNPNGEPSYSKWEGGMFGVLSKQMEDFNDFNRKWYMEEMTNEMQE
jgi:hypothetical protein